MSIIESEESRQYSSYLEWKEQNEQYDNEIGDYDFAGEEYVCYHQQEQEADNNRAAEYMDDVAEATTASAVGDFGMGPISKWKRMAWEPAYDTVEEEAIAQQLAQITVDGIYRYDLEWLPETNEVRVEIDQFRDGLPLYYWYPDTMPIRESLASLMSCEETELKIEGLRIFGEGREDVGVEALPYELECFLKSTWHDYASEKFGVQFNIKTKEELGTCGHAEYDAACSAKTCGRRMTESAFRARLEEIWRENHPTRHGLDGTQCDCSMCVRADEMPADMEPYHESVDEDRLPTVDECLNLPKRISDALIRNWVAAQPDEDKACAEAAELARMRDSIA